MPKQEIRPLVLIADPDTEYTVLVARQLEWAGYGIITTGDGAEALELIEERRPDAVVLEAMMPGMSGYALTRRLRAGEDTRLLPIVMISTRAGKLDRDFAFTVGADDYVRKPFRCADIVARLALLAPAGPHPIVAATRRPSRAGVPVIRTAAALG